AHAAVAREQRALTENFALAQRLHDDAAALHAQSEVLEQHARQRAPKDEEIVARKAAIEGADLSIVREHFNRLGIAWEAQAETNVDAKSKKLARLREQCVQLEQSASLEEYRVSEAKKAAEQLALVSASLGSKLSGESPKALLE